MIKEISDEINGPSKEELAAQAAALAAKHAAYKKKLKGWSDRLYKAMKKQYRELKNGTTE